MDEIEDKFDKIMDDINESRYDSDDKNTDFE